MSFRTCDKVQNDFCALAPVKTTGHTNSGIALINKSAFQSRFVSGHEFIRADKAQLGPGPDFSPGARKRTSAVHHPGAATASSKQALVSFAVRLLAAKATDGIHSKLSLYLASSSSAEFTRSFLLDSV